MNILITGGLGYVGGRLSAYLAQNDDYTVYALSRSKSIEHDRIKVLKNEDVLNGTIHFEKKIDVLIHLASTNEIECSKEPQRSNQVNINGTLDWLEWSKNNQLGQFIYFSTVHVYGRPLLGDYSETSPTQALHPYSISHKSAEDYCNWYRMDHGLNTKIVRLSNSFGYPAFDTANRWTLLINDICKQIAAKKSFELFSNIKQRRDFIPLQNVCEAIEKLIHDKSEQHLFNLSKGNSMSLEEIALLAKRVAEKKFNTEIEFIYDPEKSQESEELNISNQRLRSIGWTPNWDAAEEEINKTLDFFLK